GIDVGQAVGWGLIKPERPDPRFRLTQKNITVAGWGQDATSAACGDVNGDGRPDVVIVAPDGDRSVVKFFLNNAGKFHDRPDHVIKIAHVSQPHKIRLTATKAGPYIFVAGKSAALLSPRAPTVKGLPSFEITPIDVGAGNHLRFLDDDTPLVARRFGGFHDLELTKGRPVLRRFIPEIDGPYVDFRIVGGDLLTSYGQLYRRVDGKFAKTPTV